MGNNLLLYGGLALAAVFILPHFLGGGKRKTKGKLKAKTAFAAAYESKVIGDDLFYFGRGRVTVPEITGATEVAYYFLWDSYTHHWYVVYVDPDTGEIVIELLDKEPEFRPGFLFFLYDLRTRRFHYDWDDDDKHIRRRFDIDDFPPCHRHPHRPKWATGHRIDDDDIYEHCYNINLRVFAKTHDPECHQQIERQKVVINIKIETKIQNITILEKKGQVDSSTASKIKSELSNKKAQVQSTQPLDVKPPKNPIPTTSAIQGPTVPTVKGGTTSPASSTPMQRNTVPAITPPAPKDTKPPKVDPTTSTISHPDTFPNQPMTPSPTATPSPDVTPKVPELHHPDPKQDAVAKDTAKTVTSAAHDKSAVHDDPATAHNVIKNHTLVNHSMDVKDIADQLPDNQDPKQAIKTTKNPNVHAKKSALAVNVASELGIELDPDDEEDLTSMALHSSPVRTLGFEPMGSGETRFAGVTYAPYSPISSPRYYGQGYTQAGEWGPRSPVRKDFLRLNYDKDIDFRGGLGPTNFF
jgi:hypothetical protein